LDFEITALCLAESTKFIGLIGSKTKRNKFHHMLRDELGFESGMNPVHCPVGLDLGGHTPKEIAISIAAQLLQVCYEK
jgi:xanthine dehydrogenase accessory factor